MLLLLSSLLLTGCAHRITSMSDGREVEFDRMVAELKGARAVFVGEIHDVAAHHRIQLDIIKALHEAGVPLAIGMEMFPAASQRYLDQWVAGRLDPGKFMLLYRDYWKVSWWHYSDIFLYARDNRIPLIGLNIPKGIMTKVYSKGFESLSEEERKGLPSDVTCDSADPYTGVIQRHYVGHSAGSASFAFFCEAQTLWNRGMALFLTNYLDKHPERTAVVLVGGAHAMKQGIPGQMKRYGDYSYQVVLPDIPGLFAVGVTIRDADYFVE